jgi:hypothetical protein
MQFITEKTYKAFMSGLPVLLIAAANTAGQFSKHTGFEFPYYDRYDNHGIEENDSGKFEEVAKLIAENPPVHKDTIMNNFNLMNNIEWQVISGIESLVSLIEYSAKFEV